METRAPAHDYCRSCAGPSRQTFAGWATGDGHENTVRPRAFYRQCACGAQRLVLGNVNDAEGLCRKVLSDWLRASASGSHVGATGNPLSDGAIDADDALSFLLVTIWKLYTDEFHPARGVDSFMSMASYRLPRRLATWSREASGETETRAKGRVYPKAHAASVSVSLDALRARADDQGDSARAGTGELDPRLGRVVPDFAEARSPDLLRALTEGCG